MVWEVVFKTTEVEMPSCSIQPHSRSLSHTCPLDRQQQHIKRNIIINDTTKLQEKASNHARLSQHLSNTSGDVDISFK